ATVSPTPPAAEIGAYCGTSVPGFTSRTPLVGGELSAWSTNASAAATNGTSTSRNRRPPTRAASPSASASAASATSVTLYTCQPVGSGNTPCSATRAPGTWSRPGENWWLQVRNSDANRPIAPSTTSQSARRPARRLIITPQVVDPPGSEQ